LFGSVSSEDDTNTDESQIPTEKEQALHDLSDDQNEDEPETVQPILEESLESTRKNTMKYMTEKFQKLISVRHATPGAGAVERMKISSLNVCRI
ncbi:jg20701, partial [Pararge aegeria aegeria]